MYKVVKSVPSRSISATTSSQLFGRIIEPGSPEQDVRTGFATEEEAQEFADNMARNNRLSGWRYSVKEE